MKKQKLLKDQRGDTNSTLMIVIIVLLMVIIGGMAFYYMTKSKKETTSTNGTNTATTATTTPTTTTTTTTTPSNTNTAVTNASTITLNNVKDGKGTGTAERKKVNGKYTLTIKTTNLPTVEGYDYVAWLEKKLPFSRITAGKLTKTAEGVYTLEFASDSDYSLYPFVYVTLEATTDTDSVPAQQVLTGIFVNL